MRSTARFVCTAWLVAAGACSDDGLTIQDLNSSSTGGEATGVLTTTSDSNSPPEDSSASDGAGTTIGPAGTGTDASTDVGETEGPNTTGGTGTTDATTDATGTTGEACEPITDDPSAIGVDCSGGIGCPEGYTCQPFAGIVFQESCQILCTMDCECPLGLTCFETSDKSGDIWFQCGPA